MYHSGEVTDADLELAATLYREHVKEHGSQTAEEKLVDAKYHEGEEDRREKRRQATAVKEKPLEVAKATTIETDPDLIKKFKKEKCRTQLKAWAVWLEQKGFKICSKAGQVNCLVTGNLNPLRDRLVSLVSVYGSKMAAEKCAVSSGAAVVPSAVVSKGLASTSRVVGVNGSGFESDEEEDMKVRITAQDKWGQFDDDCNVASSGTFNGK